MLPMDVRAPVAVLTLYIETSFVALFATYANLPDDSTATESGFDPAATDPMEVNAPVAESIVNIPTLFAPWFATYANLPEGSTASERGATAGAVPVEVNAPLLGFTLYTDTLLETPFVT